MTELNQTTVKFVKLDPNAIIPTKATSYSAGWDLYSLEDITIKGGQGTVLVKTGVGVILPEGTYGRVGCRSGLAYKHHLAVSAGIIDRDFRGSVGILIYCTKQDYEYTIKKGERCAQLVIEKCDYSTAEEIAEMPKEDSNTHGSGFGGSGRF